MTPGLRRSITACALLFVCFGAAAELVEDGCGFVWAVDGGDAEVVEIPNLTILEASSEQETLSFEADEAIDILAVVCWRNTVIPAENDYKVVEAGKPLYLKSPGENRERTAVVEKVGGGYRLRLIDGDAFTDDEREQVKAMIRRFNQRTGPETVN